ncbi:hypothetical protein N9O61_00505 [Octadecabacter sp.]|nr:hypothetical protein [Octadecabacter sp.]
MSKNVKNTGTDNACTSTSLVIAKPKGLAQRAAAAGPRLSEVVPNPASGSANNLPQVKRKT